MRNSLSRRLLALILHLLLGSVLLSSIPAADPELDDARRHLAGLSVPAWHDAGVQGQGMTVAVLDSGFRNYRDFLGKGLPASVGVRSFRKDGDLEARPSQHGILCGEVLHTVAPRAKLLLANWEPDDPQTFLDAVRWAKQQGARIVTCSVIMPGWSDGEGGGPVHRALDNVLGDGSTKNGLLMFACAGNTAQRHWHGTFSPDPSGRHQWRTGDVVNHLHPWNSEPVTVELYGAMHGRYKLQVFENASDRLAGEATSGLEGSYSPAIIRFRPSALESYRVVVTGPKVCPTGPEKFHLVALGGNLEFATSQGSIPFPGDGARVITVGAVDRGGQRPAYSSCGPNSRCPKPDLVAPVPFPSRCRETPFAGTSAAAPQAAGLASLLWCRLPNWTPEQIRRQLHGFARDLGSPGHDYETGHGVIQLPGLVNPR